ncbi:Protein SRC2 [Melia azedarach]|uniref:Protein SRC2 n=1 Tax=Melia azedarach TaxID=155640 RepID=A0ACC1YED3_MELAZ|nr:Protein SRC2 [Melia azedarach]
MAYRSLDINVVSAKHLNDVSFLSKMNVYVVVSIKGYDRWAGKKKQKSKTHVDRAGGSNPTWNFPLKFTVDENLAQQNRLTLVFKIKCDGFLGDKNVGEVTVPIKELLDSPGDGKSMSFVSYQVRKPSGKPKGELTFSYKFGDVIPAAAPTAFYSYASVPTVAAGKVKADEPVTAYPAGMAPTGSSSAPYAAAAHAPYPPPSTGYAYPPPPPAGAAPYGGYPPPPTQPGRGYPPQPGHGYPPQPGYGYPPPPPPGYGYPPAQKPPKKSLGGMGLGAGLLGGMLGGLLIGDIVSDAADCDGGDFDF